MAELRKLPLSRGKVFAQGLPKMETFKRDLRRAAIEFIDAKGRRADFHSLRHTLGTNLALAGTAPRVAMEAMRHSDIRLTTKTYTDTGLLSVSDAVAKLPSFLDPPGTKFVSLFVTVSTYAGLLAANSFCVGDSIWSHAHSCKNGECYSEMLQ